VAVAPPGAQQGLRRLAHRQRHFDRPPGRVRRRHRIVEEHHDAVAGIVIERALEMRDDRPAPAETVFSLTELDRMLPLCDTVLIACGLAPETRDLIIGRRLALMKPGALLINVARAPIVDEDALFNALKDGRLGGAALDV